MNTLQEALDCVKEVSLGAGFSLPMEIYAAVAGRGKIRIVLRTDLVVKDSNGGADLRLYVQSEPFSWKDYDREDLYNQTRRLIKRLMSHEVDEFIRIKGQRNPVWAPHSDGTTELPALDDEQLQAYAEEIGLAAAGGLTLSELIDSHRRQRCIVAESAARELRARHRLRHVPQPIRRWLWGY